MQAALDRTSAAACPAACPGPSVRQAWLLLQTLVVLQEDRLLVTLLQAQQLIDTSTEQLAPAR